MRAQVSPSGAPSPRTHCGLGRETPAGRAPRDAPSSVGRRPARGSSRRGGSTDLHRYLWREAAWQSDRSEFNRRHPVQNRSARRSAQILQRSARHSPFLRRHARPGRRQPAGSARSEPGWGSGERQVNCDNEWAFLFSTRSAMKVGGEPAAGRSSRHLPPGVDDGQGESALGTPSRNRGCIRSPLRRARCVELPAAWCCCASVAPLAGAAQRRPRPDTTATLRDGAVGHPG
jgi:hypothetical protein